VNRDEPVAIRSNCDNLTQRAQNTVLTTYHTITSYLSLLLEARHSSFHRCMGIRSFRTVKMELQEADIIPYRTCRLTPLLWAVKGGHEAVVKLLLEWGDVNPSTSDGYRHTPLFIAAWAGQEGMVKMLLERGDVNPN